MTNNQIWVIFLLSVWILSNFYFYSIGWYKGGTDANIEAAKYMKSLAPRPPEGKK